jgi:multiple sugar transport system permease protein
VTLSQSPSKSRRSSLRKAPAPPASSAPLRTRPPRRSGGRLRRELIPWGFLLPALVVFAYFKFYPMAKGVYLSFFEVSPFAGNEFIGLDNFTRAFEDEELRSAFVHTVIDVVFAVGLSALVGFGLALLLQGQARHVKFVRTAAFLPVTVAVAVVAEVWRVLLWPASDGTVNSLLSWLPWAPFGFLDDPNQSLASVILMQVWKSAPYDMMIFIAGLAAIDRQLYEAAAVDGANAWQRLVHITIPSLRNVFTIIVALGIIRGFRVFTDVWTLTGGGPGGSSEVVMTKVYKTGIQDSDIGYASAVSSMMFLLTAFLTAVYLYRQRRKDAA